MPHAFHATNQRKRRFFKGLRVALFVARNIFRATNSWCASI